MLFRSIACAIILAISLVSCSSNDQEYTHKKHQVETVAEVVDTTKIDSTIFKAGKIGAKLTKEVVKGFETFKQGWNSK